MDSVRPATLTAISIICGLFVLSHGTDLSACSTIKLQHGPDLLYGHNLNNNGSDVPGLVFINKRGVFKTGRSWSELINKAQSNASTVAWISRYGSVSFNTFGKDLPDGGMNEAGIYIWEMGLSNSEVIYPTDANLPKLNQMHWMQYILDTAATLDEALACAGTFEIDGWGWHFFLGDGDGNCAVIDFVDGNVVMHRGEEMPVPGLFNALYAREIEQARYFKGFGGQYEPTLTDKKVPRFVKAGVMLKDYIGQEKALDYTYKILDHLFVSEVADWSVVFDVAHRTVHFKTSLNRTIKHFAMDSFDFSNESPTRILDLDIDADGEVSKLFTPYSHDKMARHIASLPLPRAFCEMGGLNQPEFIERLARHTTKAEDQGNQPFLGTWRMKTEEAGEAPRWQLTLRSKGDLVSGEITNAMGFAINAPIEQIRLVGQEFTFTFKSREEQDIIFATASLDQTNMSLALKGLEEEYGTFELFK